MIRTSSLSLVVAAAAAVALVPSPAEACGGCFVPVTDTTVVTGHRMAMSISPVQSVLWDQIQYSGDPAEFSWVLPVMPGARVELSTDAWFEALDAATSVSVAQPPSSCPPRSSSGGFGCSADEFTDASAGSFNQSNSDVTVVHQGTVGPYETVTLSTDVPGALDDWLLQHGYAVPDGFQPVIDAYVAEGFDFIALRLLPNAGVAQMKPVRVVSPGAQVTLPLRMVAAGAGARVGVSLFVIGEGRYQAQNFPNAVIPPGLVSWDWQAQRSDYAEVRRAALGDDGTWLTPYSLRTALLSPLVDPVGFGADLSYSVGNGAVQASTIAEAYVRQGLANGESAVSSCIGPLSAIASSTDVVVDLCDENGNCTTPTAGQIGAEGLACGPLDDLATALTGLHPSSVWLTRLEADLPRALLADDLVLEAADQQSSVWHRFTAGLSLNENCEAGAVVFDAGRGRLPPGTCVALLLGAAGIGLALRRATPRLATRGARA